MANRQPYEHFISLLKESVNKPPLKSRLTPSFLEELYFARQIYKEKPTHHSPFKRSIKMNNTTNPIQALKNKGINIAQPNVKKYLEETIKEVTEQNKKAAASH